RRWRKEDKREKQKRQSQRHCRTPHETGLRRACPPGGPVVIQLTTSPTEQTTAATDLLLAAVAFAGVAFLRGYRNSHPWKVNVWGRAFAFLGAAAALGAVVHGVMLEPVWKWFLWWSINLSLALTIALFLVAALSDRWGEKAGRRARPFA